PTTTVLEGTPLTLVAELADLISPTLLHYEWSVTKLGAHGGPAVPFASGTDATFTFTPDDDGSYTVNLTVIDTQGAAGTATPVPLHVSTVPPSVGLGGAPSTAFVGALVTLGGVVHAPGTADTFTYTWTVLASNGQVVAPGSGAAFGFHPSGVGDYVITETV